MTMTNLRPYLWAALALILFVNYETWQRDYPPPAPPAAATKAPLGDLDSAVPGTAPAATAAAPSPVAAAPAAAPAVAADAPEAAAAPQATTVGVHTDVYDLKIGLRGGELTSADILQYPKVKDQPGVPVRLLRRDGNDALYVLQSGLQAATANGAATPTHQAQYSSAFDSFRLLDGTDELRVPLTWTSADGVTVTKTFVLHRGSYRVDLEYSVQNGSAAPWSAASYAQVLHDMPPVGRSYFNVDSYSFDGPAIWDGTKYRKLKIDNADDAKLSQDVTDGWLAALQHHFVAAFVPVAGAPYHYSMQVRGQQYLSRAVGPVQVVAPGATATFKETMFVGPKLQKQLNPIHPELNRVADYGLLTVLARPLFALLQFVHGLFGNWGWTIVFTTLILKLLFYPLAEISGKSMAKMRTLQPRIKNLQDTYKDDKQKLSQAMMELYKREKINPAAGCLPMLIQMPVFFAFYWVLLESVEMRQAPFMFWVHDISSRDPLFILPLLNAAAMFFQIRLQPKPADELQAKMFMIMPLVMSVTFAFFPAGLVLYWLSNTLLTIAQQWNINRRIAAG
jgi:YidC/Oxa1 family membrane protein insertase